MLDLDHPNWLPFNDPVNQLVHTEDGTAVASVMIGGRLVVENRRLVTVDLDRLRQRVDAARDRLAAANADNRRLYQALEPVVGSHCPGLAAAPYHIAPLRRAARPGISGLRPAPIAWPGIPQRQRGLSAEVTLRIEKA